MRKRYIVFLVLLSFTLCGFSQDGLKVFISADLEGVASVVTGAQTVTTGMEFEKFRKLMTDEVNAAIEGALEAGATDILVADSHGTGLNIIVSQLNPKAKLIRSWPRPLMMMEGIDETFDAVIFIGYHAGEQIPEAVLAHTMSGSRIFDIKLNGLSVNEAVFNAAAAGHFDVPVVMISGDDAIMKQTKEVIGEFEEAVVKKAIGYYSAESLHPKEACKLIKSKTIKALKNLNKYKPYKIDYPVKMEITLKAKKYAEVLALLPIIERKKGHIIVFEGKDMVEISKFISFLFQLDLD